MKATVVLIIPPSPASLPKEESGAIPNIAALRRQTIDRCYKLPGVKKIYAFDLFAPENANKRAEGCEKVDFYMGLGFSGHISALELLKKVLASLEGKDVKEPIWWIWADMPLLDLKLAERIWARHTRWHADYSNVDGWPRGFAGEIISLTTLRTLAWFAEKKDEYFDRNILFTLLQRDINAFDIETELSSVDMRAHRLEFFADSRRNWLLIERFLAHGYTGVEDSARFVAEHPLELMTLPAYVQIETNTRCPTDCPICPWPRYSQEQFGKKASERSEAISVEDFSSVLDSIVDFAGDAVIAISLWGEPAFHPQILKLAEAVFNRPSLSLIIESSGLDWEEGSIEAIHAAAKAAPARTGLLTTMRPGPLSWIISLDAHSPERYKALRGEGFQEARATAERILALAPETLWVQALRLDDGSEDLEAFWKEWRDRFSEQKPQQGILLGNQTIIQKYDYFSGYLPQRRLADLSPLKRLPCWHLKRDLAIYHNGDVPLCREDLGRKPVLGNLLKEGIEDIWEKKRDVLRSHIAAEWPKLCENCDEYYTWN